ncbi:MAG: 4a-hydroxytetrahydrobiopterin dehydratase [Chloroflexota bacterium]|nr:4a-hydroxytetrahydrobiopterin dehydratase [Chloroflexota bacterium]
MPKLVPLNEMEINARISQLSGWAREEMILKKTYLMDTYMAGLAFASAVGTVCEAMDHHPMLLIGYKRVTVSFTTDDAGGTLTENDFNAAAAVDALKYPRAK